MSSIFASGPVVLPPAARKLARLPAPLISCTVMKPPLDQGPHVAIGPSSKAPLQSILAPTPATRGESKHYVVHRCEPFESARKIGTTLSVSYHRQHIRHSACPRLSKAVWDVIEMSEGTGHACVKPNVVKRVPTCRYHWRSGHIYWAAG